MVAAGLSASAWSRAEAAMDEPKGQRPWYALLSDTHIAADPATEARGQVMARNLEAVIADVLAQPGRPEAAIIDGDLALKDGQPGDYQTLLKLIEPLRAAGVPVHLVLGNHDHRGNFRQVLGAEAHGDPGLADKQVTVIAGKAHRLILLDSLEVVDGVPGKLGPEQRAWLGRILDAEPETPAVLFVHHNLGPDDSFQLIDTEELLGLIGPKRQAKAVVFGHTHVWGSKQDDQGIHQVNLPAIGYPFAAEQPIGWCRLVLESEGAVLQLRCIGQARKDHNRRVPLAWR
jgi:hypothetical protein